MSKSVILVVLLCILTHETKLKTTGIRQRAIRFNCKKPTLINGSARLRSSGRLVRFRCKRKFKLYGAKISVCRNEEWTSPTPVCVASGRKCPKLKINEDLLITTIKKLSGGALKYSCRPGLKLNGSRTLYCDGSKWSSEVPQCIYEEQRTSCDFETADMCNWVQDESDTPYFNWKRTSAAKIIHSVGTGPDSDHTYTDDDTGHYLFMEASTPRRQGDYTSLLSPYYRPVEAGLCFEFWYHMLGLDGKGVGSLQVRIKDSDASSLNVRPLWNISGNQGDTWHKGSVEIGPRNSSFQIVITGTRGDDHRGDIAIDDFFITNCTDVREPVVPLMPPVGLKTYVLSPTTIILTWRDTTLGNNQMVQDNRYYTVRYRVVTNVESENSSYWYLNSTDLNAYIDNLRPNTKYEFNVKVIEGLRQSPWSMKETNMTPEAAPGSPPLQLTSVPNDNDSRAVIMTWQPPAKPNGQITGYLVFYTTDAKQELREWVVEGVLEGDELSATIERLTPSTTYYFKVQARNSKGYGPLSETVIYKTPKAEGSGRGQIDPEHPPRIDGKVSINDNIPRSPSPKACSPGRYGTDCKEKCGHCESNETCHHVNGSCPGLCEPGYHGEKCLTVCQKGFYGRNCSSPCGHCAKNATCDHVTGSCPSGYCEPGWKYTPEQRCDQACNNGWYGVECKEPCGYCRGNKPCHHVNGSCFGLCEPGYHGEKCENSEFSQLLAIQKKMLDFVRELPTRKRSKAELKENGTSPTDFK